MSSKVNDLPVQDLDKLDPTKLDPYDLEIMAHQATVNIGTIGHVAHGKSTVVQAISQTRTTRFTSELINNITIKLGYANAKIYKCDNKECGHPGSYKGFHSSITQMHPPCDKCGSTMSLARHVSFVDCFGLDTAFARADGSVVRNEDIQIGEQLLGPDGQPRTVKAIKTGTKELFEVAYLTSRQTGPEHGLEAEGFTCTGGHLLCLRIDTPVDEPAFDRTENKHFVRVLSGDDQGIRSTKAQFESAKEAAAFYEAVDKRPIHFEMTVEAYLNAPASVRSKARLYRAPALAFGQPEADLTVGQASEEEVAYVIGLWLGDGDDVATRFTLGSHEDEILTKLADIATKMGLLTVVNPDSDPKAVCVTLSNSSDLAQNAFSLKLAELGIAGNKHIPLALLRHSVAVRHALVAGMLDAEGAYTNGQFDLEQPAAKHALFQGFVWLVRSLGFVAHTTTHQADLQGKLHMKHRVRFNGETADQLPLASSCKVGAALVSDGATSQQFSVKSVGEGPFKGFEVDGDGCMLLSDFMVAHNCPGHDILMATMLNGAAVMDAALLLIAASESCPQPQTLEHLAAVEVMKLKSIIILQNKVDLVKEKVAASQYEEITSFIRGTCADSAPIIPISAQLRYNIDVVCEYICTKIPKPVRDFTSNPRLIVIRSFDVNFAGATVEQLVGGVAGGSILRGVLRLGQEIEIRPGFVNRDEQGRIKCTPLRTRITSLAADKNNLKYAVPGGLIGVGTNLDPSLTRADGLVGQVIGLPGDLPDIFSEIEVSYFLLRRLLGVRSTSTDPKKKHKIPQLAVDELILVNIGSTSTGGRVVRVEGDMAKIVLTAPVCTSEGEKLALSRRVEKHWRLIGWGQIRKGIKFTDAEIEESEMPEAEFN